MLTADEKRAALFLAALAAAGGLVRLVAAARPAAPAPVVAPEIRGDDVQRQVALARREAALLRPLGAGETIDLDRATARELERLPGVGPALARRMVADREANGAFGSLEAIDQVPGIGPAMLASIRPHARFSGPPRPIRQPQVRKAVEPSRSQAVGRVPTRRAPP
jgi:competence protein ComEA